MATKEDALQYIKALAAQKFITKDELIMAYDEGSGIKKGQILTKRVGIAEILYYIGGGIVFLGIAILIGQNWSSLQFISKSLATLGAGIAAYFVAFLFGRNEKTEAMSSVFYLISALVMPLGLYVVFDHAGFITSGSGLQSLISGILFGVYFSSYIVFRKNVLLLFSIFFGAWFFFGFTNFLAGGGAIFKEWKFYAYRTLVVGASYVLLGRAFLKSERAPISKFLNSFGILGFLGAAFALGEWKPEQNVFWELIFPGLTFGIIFSSVHLKSRAFLVWGTLFLMAYILKITAEYFSSGLGWPFALVIAGLCMIAIGYMSFHLRRKYLNT